MASTNLIERAKKRVEVLRICGHDDTVDIIESLIQELTTPKSVRAAQAQSIALAMDDLDEEEVHHIFSPRDPGGDDDEHGPIWCKDCEYHRDHKVHRGFGNVGL